MRWFEFLRPFAAIGIDAANLTYLAQHDVGCIRRHNDFHWPIADHCPGHSGRNAAGWWSAGLGITGERSFENRLVSRCQRGLLPTTGRFARVPRRVRIDANADPLPLQVWV